MHPFEHFLYFSTLLIFLVLPAHPMHILFLLHWQLLGAPSGHSGYEAVFAKDKARLLIGGFFHQLHHRYFECNYGSPEFPLDKWFGTFHDGTEEMTAKTRERTRNMRAQQ
jgi:sterol desaturase/sphingolipid hydroxylase (fatty acid hydroxylase superfamily)